VDTRDTPQVVVMQEDAREPMVVDTGMADAAVAPFENYQPQAFP